MQWLYNIKKKIYSALVCSCHEFGYRDYYLTDYLAVHFSKLKYEELYKQPFIFSSRTYVLQALICVLFLIGRRRSVELQQQLEAVELYNDIQRNTEERSLLIREMQDCLCYYHKTILPAISGYYHINCDIIACVLLN